MTKNYLPQQTSKWFTRQLQRKGCYFLSIMQGACKFLDKEIKPYQIMGIYEQAVEEGFMTYGCYVKNPAKIGTLALEALGFPGHRFWYVGSERDGKLDFYNESLHEDINHIVENVQVLWTNKKGETKYGSHFVTEDYNPDERFKFTGQIFGKRYFKIGEK